MTSGQTTMAVVLILAASALIPLPSVATSPLSSPPVLAAQGSPPPPSPNGTAVKLAVFPTPSALLPQANSTGEVFVQLQDANGNPAAAPSPVKVTLDSSKTNVANVTASITISQGSTYGTAFTSASFQAGVTTITASSTGLATGFAQLTVVGPKPSKLSVVVAPGVVASQSTDPALITVQLQGPDGTPAPAPAPVVVVVTSSNTAVGTISTSTFTIPVGHSFGISGLIAGLPGNTTVTAIAQGYASGTFTVFVKSPIPAPPTGNKGALSLYLGTPSILNDRSQYPTIVVQLQNASGVPTAVPLRATSNVTVYFASSNTPAGTVPIGSVPGSVLIPVGHSFAITTITSTLAVGSTVISAAAFNFISDFKPVTSAGPAPSRLAVIPSLPLVIADGQTYSTTAVQLQDAQGNPAKAPLDIVVTLASSSRDAGTVDPAVVISSGTSHAFFGFSSTLVAGTTNVTASTSGYASALGRLATTYLPMSGTIAAVTQSPFALTAVKVGLNLTSGPYPLGGAAVQWSTDSKLANVVNSTLTTDSGGGAYAYLNFGDSGNVTVGATAQKAGYGQAKFTLKLVVKPQPLTILLIPTNTILNASQSTTISAQVSSRGKPLANVAIAWSSDLGTITPPATTTNNAGSATVTFVSPTNGTANVKASASLAGYAATTQSTQITVNLAGAASGGGGGGGGGGTSFGLSTGNLTYILIAFVVVLVLLLLVRRRRRKKGKAKPAGKGEAEEEESEA